MVSADTQQRLRRMEELCVDMATYKKATYEDFETARLALLNDAAVSRFLPEWLVNCRSGSAYWDFIKAKSDNYSGRRSFVAGEFSTIHKRLRLMGIDPTAATLGDILAVCTAESVHDAWQKCIDRRSDDPEGAITSARTMVEATCKIILERLGEVPESTELPKLYKQVAKCLRLSPEQHNEQVFKQILTGCASAVEGLGSMRNSLGDAHGQGLQKIKPGRRHAELAVNLAGTICTFLMATFEARQGGK